MELLRPGDEYLSAYNPPTTDLDKLPQLGESLHHQDDPPKVEVVPEYFVFNFPTSTAHHQDGGRNQFAPCFNYPTTPCTPCTPSADVPESPFDVFTNYHHFKYSDHLELGQIDPAVPLQPYSPGTPGFQLETDQCNILPPPAVQPFPFPPAPQLPLYSSCGEATSSIFTTDISRHQYSDPRSYSPAAGPEQYHVMSRDNGMFVLDNTLILQAEEAYNRRNHENVLEILSSHFFHKSHHEQLQHLWLAAVYARESETKKKNLTAVDRYRLRKRNPFPASIWEGEKTIYCLKKSARDSLTSFFEKNPYPTPAEKRRLATSCELSYVQISNWFKNKRMREKESNRLK
ncbi:hypothetical protein ACHWQZ_G008570 [Mnemiopsis leidyi]